MKSGIQVDVLKGKYIYNKNRVFVWFYLFEWLIIRFISIICVYVLIIVKYVVVLISYYNVGVG